MLLERAKTEIRMELHELAAEFETKMETNFNGWHWGGRGKCQEIPAICQSTVWLKAIEKYIHAAKVNKKVWSSLRAGKEIARESSVFPASVV